MKYIKQMLILLSVSLFAASSAIAAVSITGSAEVTYTGADKDDSDSELSYDGSLTFAVETNNTTFTATLPITAAVDDATGAATLTDVSVATKAGDITITAVLTGDDQGVTVGVDMEAGVSNVSLGMTAADDITASATISGITASYTFSNAEGNEATTTEVGGSLGGIDFNISRANALNEADTPVYEVTTAWDVGATFSGVGFTYASDKTIGASVDLAGNSLSVTKADGVDMDFEVSRSISDNATITAGYVGDTEQITLTAAISF